MARPWQWFSSLLLAVVVFGLFVPRPQAATARSRGPDPTLAEVRAVLGRLHITVHSGDRSFLITSSSMEPTLHCARPGLGCLASAADHILVRPYGKTRPRRGDIVIFKTPQLAVVRCGAEGTFDKRVIGLPGEKLEERNGFVYIDGHRVAEPYVQAGRRDKQSLRVTIPAGRYFVMGDSRATSCDSRTWGTVPAANIIGRAIAIWWPSKRARRLG